MIDITNYFTAGMHNGAFPIILIGASFLGGVLASISPCSLGMLPIVIGYIGGYSSGSHLKVFSQLISFIIGSSIVFSVIGVVCALTGHIFISILGGYFVIIIASTLLAMGLNLIGALDINLPSIINKVPSNSKNSTYLYPMLLGGVFALAGTPCSTPILASIIGFASISDNILLSLAMLFGFALGQGVILVVAGMFANVVKQFSKIVTISDVLLKISGTILILASIYIYYKMFIPFFD
jgi:cytochrome c-type biogenesis protein